MVSPRLHIDNNGRLQGSANITYNSPWPTANCSSGFGTAFGGVYHTEVGFEHSVIAEFNNPSAQASSFFSIGMDGHIHQYMPLGQNLKAWTQEAGNTNYRGVEHEDHGDDSNPLSQAQLIASAQVFEAMSAYDGWPLQASDNPGGGRGILFHSDGGQAWGGHDCPGAVRRAQRPAIIALARQIRAGGSTPVPAAKEWVSKGMLPLGGLAEQLHVTPAVLLAVTAEHSPRMAFTDQMAVYVDAVFGNDAADMGKGLTWHYQVMGTDETWVTDPGNQPLHALAQQLGTIPSLMLRMTCEHSADGLLQGAAAAYVNGVFSRSSLHLAAGTILYYR
jgi:N-acetylmuramoyl-L-alanine amidase